MIFHEQDQLVEVPAGTLMTDLETFCQARAMTLDLSPLPEDASVGQWIAEGFPGTRSPFLDPSDHVLAGLEGTLKNAQHVRVSPCPRRAAGPDLTALFIGQWGRFGTVQNAWIRVHAKSTTRPMMPLHIDTNPELTPMEKVLLLILEKEVS
jgi:alkyldihydroxyacetonephosphate synthase